MNKQMIRSAAAAALATGLTFGIGHADEEDGMDLIMQAKQTLEQCYDVTEECRGDVAAAAGVLIFPEVLKADLLLGGAGGNGVLMVDGEPQGFYDIGKASIGLQAGIDEMAVIYVLEDLDNLREVQDGSKWDVAFETGLTLFTANADAVAEAGDTEVYVFDADGLNAEIDVTALRIWRDGENAY
jgi:lipid-binding SYLF domain-containing protein